MNAHGPLAALLWAAGLAATLAQAPAPVAPSHTILLPSAHVTVECDDQGTWTRVFASESEPVASTGPGAVSGSQAAASRRAAGWLTRFLHQQATEESLAAEIAEGVRGSAAEKGGEAAVLPPAAQRQLAAGLAALRAAFGGTGGNPPVVRSETGYDPDKSTAWGRRSVRNPGVSAAAQPVHVAPGVSGGGERAVGGVVGGVVGGLPQAPPMRIDRTLTPLIQTYRIEPVYPAIAQSARVQGVVIIEVLIGSDGKVEDVRVLHSIPLLDAAAVEAVRQWEWRPMKIDGVGVPVVMTATVNFILQ